MTTAYITDERFAEHTLEGHPESAARLTAIGTALRERGLDQRLRHLTAVEAPAEAIAAVHSDRYLERLARTEMLSQPMMFELDTYVTPHSYAAVRLAAGATIRAVEAVLRGEARHALAAVRPPGHHATRTTGMGFCLLNNVAIAARYAVQVGGVRRVMIVDVDVHHGNGTQDIFYDDPSVLFVSSHQSPLYPGTGMIEETGQGAGIGYTVNIPLPPGTGDQGFERVYESIVLPVGERFAPELILVSAGFDAHWADPLANLCLSLTGFARLVRLVLSLAEAVCGGRIVFVLEGGYNLQVLGAGWANLARVLLGEAEIDEPLGAAHSVEPALDGLIERIRRIHKLT